ncbi:MAG: class I SAM-dependent methyltransferase [Verrucomicrobiaceae bacterium]|nr:class I SAM-dependent methyltransferase [Verrucomicrobiaceae bacterium]
MEPGDWKKAAHDYNEEVLSVFENDRKGKVKALIKRLGNKQALATDLGCGVGKFLPLMARSFGRVHACDYSIAMLERAKTRHGKLGKVTFAECDLRKSPPDVAPADFVLCVNVLITPSLAEREMMWKNLARSVRPGGHVALVLPSLESALLTRHRLVEWNLRDGQSPARALQTGFGKQDPGDSDVARGGILDCAGIPTKHYLQTEISTTARRFSFHDRGSEKIEYPWSTEFHSPPRWMRDPFPWDWLALLEKI